MLVKLKSFFRNSLLNGIEATQQSLMRLKEKLTIKSDTHFEDLTPKVTLDPTYRYDDVFDFVINNKKIMNLAVTGPYGAGKSSAISSYFHNKSWIKTLNISLASFCELETGELKPSEMQTLERSILQQMFYKVKSKNIPATGFRRIIVHRPFRTFTKLLLLSIGLFSIIVLIFPSTLDFKESIITPIVAKGWDEWNAWVLVVIAVLTIGYTLYSAYLYLLNNVKVKLFKTKFIDIELNNTNTDSLFNRNIDEILYFFETTDFTVVVFEDIDRFSDEGIFVKLRELNTLINNSDQINRRVLFVYAVKDELFINQNTGDSKSRTKFFDFIIPIVPVVHTTNSSEVMISKFKQLSPELMPSEEVIRDIGIHLGDMRVIINILNEFIVYYEKIGGHLFQSKDGKNSISKDKLLGMITYKNVYPADFAKLQDNSGILFNEFKNKNTYITSEVKEIDDEINIIEKKLKESKLEIDYVEEELRSAYVYGIKTHLGNTLNITINSSQFDIWRLMDPGYFELLPEDTRISYGGFGRISKDDLLTVFKTKPHFVERLALIQLKLKDKENELLLELQNLRIKKAALKKMSLQDLLLERKSTTLSIEDNKLLYFLLSNGHIDERYHDYMSYFKEGILSVNDHLFLLSVKDKKSLPFNHDIYNVDEVFRWLSIREFSRIEILNYDLFDYLLSNKKEIELDTIFKLLKMNLVESRDFMWSIWRETNQKYSLSKFIAKYWNDYVSYLLETSYSDKEVIDIIIDLLINLDKEELIDLNDDNLLSQYISSYTSFLLEIEQLDKCDYHDIAIKLRAINVIFYELEEPGDLELFRKIVFYEKNYGFCPSIIATVLKSYGAKCDPNRMYSSVIESKCEALIDHVNGDLNNFVNSVLLLGDHLTDDEIDLLFIYNHEDVPISIVSKLIKIEECSIFDVESISYNSVLNLLMKERKLAVSWKNIHNAFRRIKMSDELVEFLNDESVRLELLSDGTFLMDDSEDELYAELCYEVMTDSRITDESVEAYSKKMKLIGDIDVENVQKSRIKLLIELGSFELSKNRYDELFKGYPELCTVLIKKNIDLYVRHYFKRIQKLSQEEIGILLTSHDIDLSMKSKLVSTVLFSGIYSEVEIEEILAGNLSTSLLHEVIAGDSNLETKSRVLFSQFEHLSAQEVIKFMTILGGVYERIASAQKQATIRLNDIIPKHLDALKLKGIVLDYEFEDSEKIRVRINNKSKRTLFSKGDI